MHDYFQLNHLEEFLSGNHYHLILKVPNNSIIKIQQNKKNRGLNIYYNKMINLVDQYTYQLHSFWKCLLNPPATEIYPFLHDKSGRIGKNNT